MKGICLITINISSGFSFTRKLGDTILMSSQANEMPGLRNLMAPSLHVSSVSCSYLYLLNCRKITLDPPFSSPIKKTEQKNVCTNMTNTMTVEQQSSFIIFISIFFFVSLEYIFLLSDSYLFMVNQRAYKACRVWGDCHKMENGWKTHNRRKMCFNEISNAPFRAWSGRSGHNNLCSLYTYIDYGFHDFFSFTPTIQYS